MTKLEKLITYKQTTYAAIGVQVGVSRQHISLVARQKVRCSIPLARRIVDLYPDYLTMQDLIPELRENLPKK